MAQCEASLQHILAKVTVKEDSFCFKPSYTPLRIMKPHLFREMNKEVSLMPLEACLPRAQTLLVTATPYLTLLKAEVSGKDSEYDPQAMLWQLGYNKGTV